MNMQQNKVSYPHTATDFLQHAAGTLGERGKQYDTGGKQERSMAKIVAAFNAVHDANGAQLTEQQGWTFMMLLKLVRGAHTPHLDSALDAVGYAALYGECVAEQLAQQEAAEVATLQGSITHVEKAAMFGSEPVLYAYKGMATLCQDEGCPHHGSPHVCVTSVETSAQYSYRVSEQLKQDRVAELEAMLREALDKQAIIENRNDNLAAQLGEANAGYEQLQDKLRSAEEALRLSSAARYDAMESYKQLAIRNDELHSDVSQAIKELTEIRAECAARTEELESVRHSHAKRGRALRNIYEWARHLSATGNSLKVVADIRDTANEALDNSAHTAQPTESKQP